MIPVYVCAYCQKPATDERPDPRHKDRIESVCDQCAEDLDRGAECLRRELAYEAHVDQKLSEWKENRRS